MDLLPYMAIVCFMLLAAMPVIMHFEKQNRRDRQNEILSDVPESVQKASRAMAAADGFDPDRKRNFLEQTFLQESCLYEWEAYIPQAKRLVAAQEALSK